MENKKKAFKIYITSKERTKLLEQAQAVGLSGRGCLSRYISKIAISQICFLDDNVQKLISVLNLKVEDNGK